MAEQAPRALEAGAPGVGGEQPALGVRHAAGRASERKPEAIAGCHGLAETGADERLARGTPRQAIAAR